MSSWWRWLNIYIWEGHYFLAPPFSRPSDSTVLGRKHQRTDLFVSRFSRKLCLSIFCMTPQSKMCWSENRIGSQRLNPFQFLRSGDSLEPQNHCSTSFWPFLLHCAGNMNLNGALHDDKFCFPISAWPLLIPNQYCKCGDDVACLIRTLDPCGYRLFFAVPRYDWPLSMGKYCHRQRCWSMMIPLSVAMWDESWKHGSPCRRFPSWASQVLAACCRHVHWVSKYAACFEKTVLLKGLFVDVHLLW